MLFVPFHNVYSPKGYTPPTGTLTANVSDTLVNDGASFANWTAIGANTTIAAGGISTQATTGNGATIQVGGLVANQRYRCRARFTSRPAACTLRVMGWGNQIASEGACNFGAPTGGAAFTMAIPGVCNSTTNPSGSTFPIYTEIYFTLYAQNTGLNRLTWQLDGVGGQTATLSEFAVFPAPTFQYRLAVKGDIYGTINTTYSDSVNNSILAVDPDGVIQSGDSSDSGAGPATSCAALMVPATTPWTVIPTLGNHDASYGIENWKTYYSITAINGTGAATYWRRLPDNNGPIHMFLYNNVPSGDGGGTEGAGYNTTTYGTPLVNAINASNAAWKIVLCHRPAMSDGSGALLMKSGDTYDGSNTWNWLSRNVMAVIGGHIHGQERFLVGGMTYITNALGGSNDHHALTAAGSSGSVMRSVAADGAGQWSGYGLFSFDVSQCWYEYFVTTRAGVTASDPNTHIMMDRIKYAYV